KKTIEAFGAVLEPTSEMEKNSLKIRLANAGFRSESAPAVFRGLRLASLIFLGGPALLTALTIGLTSQKGMLIVAAGLGVGFYGPNVVLWYLRSKRQQDIFLTLPDALDLMVVCVESGLGLDAAMRRVTDE